jgi:hypothetical protein
MLLLADNLPGVPDNDEHFVIERYEATQSVVKVSAKVILLKE